MQNAEPTLRGVDRPRDQRQAGPVGGRTNPLIKSAIRGHQGMGQQGDPLNVEERADLAASAARTASRPTLSGKKKLPQLKEAKWLGPCGFKSP